MTSPVDSPKVAIIGVGLTGIVSLRNLLEQGFEVTAFERDSRLGGIWRWTPQPDRTSVLTSTVANTSKQYACFQDYPFPEDIPDYPSAAQVLDYLESYAVHFNLLQHCRFNIHITRVDRSSDGQAWTLSVTDDRGPRQERFDKVLISTGPFSTPFIPQIEGLSEFNGKVIHAQAYKGSEAWKGKVAVVGMSNSGCDIAVDLCHVADEVYVSHRSGGRIVKRCLGGRPLDHSLTRRVQGLLGRLPPFLQAKILDHALDQRMHQSFPEIDPHWRLSPAPPDSNSTAIFNERFIPLMGSGAIRSVSGIARFTESGFETDDGRNIEIDAIIFASGYRFDYSILSREADPTSRPTPEWDSSPHFNGLPYPWLYQTLFSTGYADSLAFIGPCAGYTFATFKHADLASQAIAQVWRGSFTLPSKREMDDWCETNYRRSLGSIKSHHIPKTGSDARKLERWLNQVAGNGLDARLGWGTEGWELWWKDRELYKLLTNGVDTPFAQRLFDGRLGSRMRWEGARRAIYRANGRNYHGVKEVEVEGDSERVEGDATAAG